MKFIHKLCYIFILVSIISSILFSESTVSLKEDLAKPVYTIDPVWLNPSKEFLPNVEITPQQHFVIVIMSYNNKDWYTYNLDSIFAQKYPKTHYRVIYIDDCSPDDTGKLVHNYIQANNLSSHANLICNTQHRAKTANIYTALHLCHDNEIAVILDGDDWLAHCDVLQYLNEIYTTKNIWMTYGAYQEVPGNNINFCRTITQKMILRNNFRTGRLITSALRSFYAWLFKNIKLEDFFYQGKFMQVAGDVAKMYPMFEMAGSRFYRNDHVVYMYNKLTPINDYKINRSMQKAVNAFVLKKKKYSLLKNSGIEKRSIRSIDVLSYDTLKKLNNRRLKKLSSYVLLTRNQDDMNLSQDYLIKCAELLEQTKATAYFISMNQMHFNKNHTYEKISNNLFAWQFGYGPKLTACICTQVILRKEDIKAFLLAPISVCKSHKLGLFGERMVAHYYHDSMNCLNQKPRDPIVQKNAIKFFDFYQTKS